MYETSQAFKTATSQPIQKHLIRGTINGASFAQSDVLAKSFKISGQLCENSKITLGGVYISKLELTFATSYASAVIPRGSWQGAVIVPELGIELAGGTAEYIPAPAYSYIVHEAKWTENGLAVIAYDNMSKFDKSLDLNESAGVVYDFLLYACNRCGVQLGMTAEQCAALCNGGYLFGLYPDDGVKTYRDMIAWLAQANASYALIGRDGKLYLKELPAPDANDTINTQTRFTGASFSDFETYYTGLSVVNIENNTTSYYNLLPDNGLTMNLGSNPFLQYGTDAIKTQTRTAILSKLAQFRATPFSAAMLTNPAYDLGDCLLFIGGIASNNYGVIMQYVMDIDKISVLGFGENPALMSAQSKTDKDISGLKGQNKDNRITYYTYSNVAPETIADGDDPEQVVNLRFATIETTTVTLWQEFKLDVELTDPDTPATITAHYFIDGIEESYSPVQTIGENGEHILGLQYYIRNVDGGTAHTWTVTLEIDGGDADMDAGNIHVCLSGQGLVGSDAFTGYIEASDTMPLFVVAGIACGTFTDTAALTLNAVNTSSASDTMPALPVGGSATLDYIQDANGDDITDAEGDPIASAQAVTTNAITAPTFSEAVVISLTIADDYAAFVTGNTNSVMYCGDDLDAGLFNVLH